MNPPTSSLSIARAAAEGPPPPDANHWFAESLDAVAGLGRTLAAEMQGGGTPVEVFTASRPAIRRLADFEALGFLSVSEDGLEFNLESVEPPELRDAIQREVDHQIAEGTFGWSLYQNRPVIVPATQTGSWVLLHVLATPRRVMGMLVGSLESESTFIPDICQKALSILLLNSASVMESGLLHKELDEHNRNLEATIEERTRELRESEKAARAASRAKSDFLANMSHEIRTPINGVVGMNSLMLEGDLDLEQREQAETIQRSADSLLSIINDILDFSKIEAGRLDLETVPYDLKQVVEDVAELLSTKAAEKGIELAATFQKEAPRHILGDPGRMRQILTNLVGNAIKFTADGQVVVEVLWRDGGLDEPHFLVSVHDTGIGIPPDKLERVFEKFTQADSSTTRNYGGTGLGLSISRQLTQLMGGRLSARSEPGQGSTFYFTLPAELDPDALGSVPEAELAGDQVLVVAQNLHVAAAVAIPLEARGAKVLVVNASRDGEIDVRHGMTSLRAVFADWSLGPARLAEVKHIVETSVGPEAPVVGLLVPITERREAQPFLQRGFDHLILKPVRERRLLAVLGLESAADAAREGQTSEGGPTVSRRILLAEDDPVNRAVATSMLSRLGCDVEVAEDGQAAVERVTSAAPGYFDLVLMDCQMPVMDGYEATRRIRDHEGHSTSRLPILALTASALHGDRERGLEAGMDDYLTKPIRMDDVRSFLSRWLPAAAREVAADEKSCTIACSGRWRRMTQPSSQRLLIV
jgi:signal transduction histidine kinase/CheY-like chemotaxis protein